MSCTLVLLEHIVQCTVSTCLHFMKHGRLQNHLFRLMRREAFHVSVLETADKEDR